MWGAIIGDLAGSVYEYEQAKKCHVIPEVGELIKKDSFFSDDTILTIAIYDAIFHNNEYEKYLKLYGKKYLEYVPNTSLKERFSTTFGKSFRKWLFEDEKGHSTGNGAMMRISGIGKMFNKEIDVMKNAYEATATSHDSYEAVKCATSVALVIYYARKGISKRDIMKILNIKNLDYYPFEHFNGTCYETISNCYFATFTSTSFEEALRKAISLGGDTDTDGAIVGAMAEALYGVPEYLIKLAKTKIPEEFTDILNKAYFK